MNAFARRAALGAALALGCAAAGSALAINVPKQIRVPAGNERFLVGHASGVQIYTCTDAGTWGTASTPQATLVGSNGRQIATHFAGPTWQADDGSKVVGARVGGVTVAADAIPWLLLRATSTSPGPGGGRLLVPTTYIQRLNTTGGLAPAGSCTPSTQVQVPYTADYSFWRSDDAQ